MYSIKHLFSGSYWFSQPESATALSLWLYVALFFGLLIAGLVVRLIARVQTDNARRTLMYRWSSLGLTMGLFGAIWLFFRQERIALFGWRMWLLLWDIVTIVWIYKIVHYMTRRMPEIKKYQEAKQVKEKYLP